MSLLTIGSNLLLGGDTSASNIIKTGGGLLPESWGGLQGQIQGFFQGGFSCLGAQAWTKQTLADMQNLVINESKDVNSSAGLANFLTAVSDKIGAASVDIPRLKSACSRQNYTAYKTFLENIIAKYDQVGMFTKVVKTKVDYKGATYQYTHYTATANVDINSITVGTLTPSAPSTNNVNVGNNIDTVIDSGNTLVSETDPLAEAYANLTSDQRTALLNYANETGTDVLEATTSFINGTLILKDGQVTWSANAGNQQNNNLLLYGVIGVVVYFMFIKKK